VVKCVRERRAGLKARGEGRREGGNENSWGSEKKRSTGTRRSGRWPGRKDEERKRRRRRGELEEEKEERERSRHLAGWDDPGRTVYYRS